MRVGRYELPSWTIYVTVAVTLLAVVPLAIIARARVVRTNEPPLHVVFDMDNQAKFKPQAADPMFADGRAMRPPVPGTVARDLDPPEVGFATGKRGGEWLTSLPEPVTERLLHRGQARYDIFCAPCHGLAGYGDGMVAKRAEALMEGTWTPPSSFHTDLVRGRTDGELFNTVTNGIRNMPAYGPQIPAADRWAIVAYVRALQRSQDATIDDVPPDMRAKLR